MRLKRQEASSRDVRARYRRTMVERVSTMGPYMGWRSLYNTSIRSWQSIQHSLHARQPPRASYYRQISHGNKVTIIITTGTVIIKLRISKCMCVYVYACACTCRYMYIGNLYATTTQRLSRLRIKIRRRMQHIHTHMYNI